MMEMTLLEKNLKRCYERRDDIQGRILSAEELTQYIAWMSREYGRKAGVSVADIPDLRSPVLKDAGRRLQENPGDEHALRLLLQGYASQKESRYIISRHDISASRVLRYMPAHWHSDDYFELCYASSGECPVCFLQETVRVSPGTVLITAPGIVHATPCYADDACLSCFMIRSSTFERVFWNQLPESSLLKSFFRSALSGKSTASWLSFDTGGDTEISGLLMRIHSEYLADDTYASQVVNAMMTLFFALLLRRHEGTARLPVRSGFYWRQEYSGILSDIQIHCSSITLSALAAKYHYSEKQIGRIVKSCTGMNFKALVTKLCMEKAGEYLLTGTSIETVSAAAGYSTVSSFYRAFEAYFHCSPDQYRKKI